MKERRVQRSVRVQRYDRVPGEGPVLGRVSRMPRFPSKGTRRRRKVLVEGRKPMDPRKAAFRRLAVVIWSSLLVVATAGALAAFLWFWVRESRRSAAAAVAAAESTPVVDRVVSRFPSPSEDEALATVREAPGLRRAERVGELFRLGGHDADEVMVFLDDLRRDGAPPAPLTWWGSMDANGLLLDGVVLGDLAGNPRDQRLALLTPDDEGWWKLDFGSFARVVEPSWERILAGSAPVATVRVIVAEDSYFNGPFREEDGWECYGMASPDIEEILNGYCRKDSPQAAAMRRITEDPNKITRDGRPNARRATLEITRHPEGGQRQFEITRVIAEDWVLGERDFEEGFRQDSGNP